ncbi:tellurite resistance TerB family protein [Pseudooceanicola sp. C21-150M6]|uniref:tellurite resistance TerB family protein n=1 Tax=Pseudooceanicola sp. C21-150M6 TaxID=3434355 RepID=UPI003D7F40E0
MTESDIDIAGELTPLTPQDCLVVLMVAVSASDTTVRTSELIKIESQVNTLPIFGEFDIDRLAPLSNLVFDLFSEEDGLDALFGLIRDNLPDRLNETAYALCCDVAAADGAIRQGELRMLEEMRDELNIDRLHAGAIERGARARHMTL